jgi:hypothetical protein
MKRFAIALLGASSLVAATTGTAFAAFPDQPGTNVQNACAVIAVNPGTGQNGAATSNMAAIALSITTQLYVEACFNV